MENHNENEIIIQHLVKFLRNQNDSLDLMSKEIDRLRNDVGLLKKEMDFLRARADTPIELLDWIDTKTALRMLNLRDPDTLRKYAKGGLIVQQRGADRRNYYVKSQILGLTQSLINQ